MEVDGWIDHEGFVWSRKKAAIEHFGNEPFSLQPVQLDPVAAGPQENYNGFEEEE